MASLASHFQGVSRYTNDMHRILGKNLVFFMLFIQISDSFPNCVKTS